MPVGGLWLGSGCSWRGGDRPWLRRSSLPVDQPVTLTFSAWGLLAPGDVELDFLSFLQAAVAATGDRAEVHEHVRATSDLDEAVALVALNHFTLP
jgi:hypothetical protein